MAAPVAVTNPSPFTADQRARLNAVWAIAEKAGVQAARAALDAAVTAYETAVAAEPTARDAVRDATEALDSVVADAEWILDDRFLTEGNRTYLLDDDAGTKRQMTADERKAWKNAAALKMPEARAATARLRQAEQVHAQIRADITLGATRVSACKHALDAAAALFAGLAGAIQP